MNSLNLLIIFLLFRVSFTFRLPPNHLTDDNINLGIVGGNFGSVNQFPYLAVLTLKLYPICGGTILNENFILTASHCLIDQNGLRLTINDLAIFVGMDNLNSPAKKDQYYKVKKYYINPNYRNGLENDVALIELTRPIKLNNITIKSACIDYRIKSFEYLISSGFGAISPFYSSIFGQLTLPKQGTKLKYAYFKEASFGFLCDSKNFICVKPFFNNTEDSVCSGDSGGPLTSSEKNIVGVVNAVFALKNDKIMTENDTLNNNDILEYCRGRAGAQFVRLSNHVNFIERIVGNRYCSIK